MSAPNLHTFDMKTAFSLKAESMTMKKMALYFCVTVLIAAAALFLPGRTPVVQAQNGNMWTINYWSNANWQGFSPFSQSVSLLAFNWGTGAPMLGMPVDNFTATANTSAWFNAGTFQFSAQSDDEITLVIDGITYINTINQGQSGKTQFVNVPLNAGWHSIRVDYREYTGNAYLFVNWWQIDGPPATPAPPVGNLPAPGTEVVPSSNSVITDFGDFTPCIEQDMHQRQCFVSNGAWNAPNFGSVNMEPQILIWNNCTPDTVQSMQIFVNTAAQSATCSRTGAGWFPR